MITVYHITLFSNWPSIKQCGLIPQIGPNSQALGETKPAIYLFPDLESSNNALDNWFGDLYDDDQDLIRLTINCPNSLVHKSDVEYEIVSYQTIPAKYISQLHGTKVPRL